MPSVLIVGGGVIGCATAYYLARGGAEVTVIERGAVSGEASGAAAGILAPLSDHGDRPPFYYGLVEQSLSLFDELLPELARTGIDVRHRVADLLEIPLTGDEAETLRAKFGGQPAPSGARWLDAAEARALEPGLTPKARGAYLTPDVRYLDPQRLTQALAEAARRDGATIRENEAVTRLLKRGDRLRGVQTALGVYEADQVLIAAGPWTADLSARLGAEIPVRPMRGQMLSLQSPDVELRHIVHGSHAFALPREDGQTYVGATLEDAGYRKRTTAAGLRRLRTGVAGLVPALAGAPVRSAWAGLRPASPDGLPILGLLPSWRNAWVSGGHYRVGILLSPLSGKLMAQSMLSGSEAGLPPGLTPRRFQR